MTIGRTLRLVASALFVSSAGLAAIQPRVAFAHERRDVGKYQLVVGFQNEPAIQGEPNGPSLRVSVPGEGGRPVEGLADTLAVQVAFGGGQPKAFPLRAVRNDPGSYGADFIPTRAGTYIFTFTGSIEGTTVNERFESGPGRFNDVEAVEAVQFPEPIPAGNDVARVARAATQRAEEAEAAAAGARTVGMIGVGLGVLGVLIGAAAFAAATSRRTVRSRALAEPDAR
jgi:hypothetical protein